MFMTTYNTICLVLVHHDIELLVKAECTIDWMQPVINAYWQAFADYYM